MVLEHTGEIQVCFPTSDGLFTLCNYVVRNKKEIWSNTGKYLKLPRYGKSSKKKENHLAVQAKGDSQEAKV